MRAVLKRELHETESTHLYRSQKYATLTTTVYIVLFGFYNYIVLSANYSTGRYCVVLNISSREQQIGYCDNGWKKSAGSFRV